MMKTLEHNLHNIKQSINQVSKKNLIGQKTPLLLAISKQQGSEKIRKLFSLGISAFGENYLNETQKKQAELSDLEIEWHFTGTIQSNKTKNIALCFDWIHTVDRCRIVDKLAIIDKKPLNILLQVNIDKSPTKSGVSIENIEQLAKRVIDTRCLKLRGLMAVPDPINEKHIRKAYRDLFNCFCDLKNTFPDENIDSLSMGMTEDFKIAIEEGSTIVRIGSGLFGPRNY